MADSIEDDGVDDGLQLFTLVEEETCDAITDLFNQAEDHVTSVLSIENILPTVEIDGQSIYKSTLVSQVNGNVFLTKGRLARIQHVIQFNNHDNYLHARFSCGSSL